MEAEARLTAFGLDGLAKPDGAMAQVLARIPAVLVMSGGAISFAAWASGLVPVIRLVPSSVAMNPVTALLFIAAAISLWRVVPPSNKVDGPALILAALVCLTGALKLADYVLGLSIHPDQLLFPHKLHAGGLYPPGELAPNTCLGFVLGGTALLLIHFETRRLILTYQILTLWTGLIALVALIGYSYHVLLFYRIGTAIPMSLETAGCFALLSLGLLAARPDRGLMTVVTSQTTGGVIARRLIPMAIVVPWILGALLLSGEQVGYWQREFGVAIFAVASIVIFSSLIGWNAKLLFEADLKQRQNDLRLAAQHHSTRVLAESVNVRRAIPELLRVTCESLGWQLGAFWSRDGQSLRCTELWCSAGDSLREFAAFNRAAVLSKGEDLPGQVWSKAQREWIATVDHGRVSPRLRLAAQSGLRTACAFPLWVGQELFGVLEFFSGKDEPPDDALQEMLSAVSTQAGLFVERTQAEEQLRQTSANLQRSNTDLQQFAYVASHDLFEPLRMVMSYLQLLSHRYSGKLDAQASEFIALAVDGARRMEALIHDLLEYSRVDIRGRAFEPVATEQIFQEAVLNLKVAIEESGAVIEHGPLPQVVGDSVQLTQLFQNLIGNAIKFRGPKPPRVEVSAEQQGQEWRFRVKDNGIGIDPKHFQRVFVLFQRLHTRQEYAGTGMGLAICKKIVERHGGRIWVESEPGQGAAFWFTLPVPEGSSQA